MIWQTIWPMLVFIDSIRAFFDDVIGWIETLSADPIFYAVIFTIAGLDSVVPVVPGETTVILGGISAGQGNLSLLGVIAAGAFGAAFGDSIAYGIGRWGSGALQRWVIRGEKGANRLAWASRQLEIRGGVLLLTARFIPGGRTIVTLASGITGQRYRRFLAYDLIACSLWATYAGGLGYFFGERFEDNQTIAFILAFITAVGVSVVIEAVRWGRAWWSGGEDEA